MSARLTDTDIQLLLFLWKWKVSTTAALSMKFYGGDRTPCRGYKRLWLLERAGFIQSRFNFTGRKAIWMPTRKGFRAIRGLLPQLAAEGYLSEHIGHDLLTTAVHLGDWLTESPAGADFFSEQELRRVEPEAFPAWVPRMERHRSDGYWRVPDPSGFRTIALEVELNSKKESDYSHIGRVYELHRLVHGVVWAVPTISFAEKIHKAISKAARASQPHNFILVEEFFHDGWQSIIRVGNDVGIPVVKLLGKDSSSTRHRLSVPALLNVRKAPHYSGASATYAIGDFSN